jgi:hypothetical protein
MSLLLLERVKKLVVGERLTAKTLVIPINGLMLTAYTNIAQKTATTTLTAAEVLTQFIVGTPAAAVQYTLPTAGQLIVQLTQQLGTVPEVGLGFDVNVTNVSTTAANTITILTGTGITLSGNMIFAGNAAVTDNSQGILRFVRTSVGFTVYRVA